MGCEPSSPSIEDKDEDKDDESSGCELYFTREAPWAPHQTDEHMTVVSVEDEAHLRDNIKTLLSSDQAKPFVDSNKIHMLPDGVFKDKDGSMTTVVEYVQKHVMGGWSLQTQTQGVPQPTVKLLVLMDIVLVQGGDGVEICKKLRAAFGEHICVIAATCNSSRMLTQHYKRSGFDGILSKEFTRDNMIPLLQSVFRMPHGWQEFL